MTFGEGREFESNNQGNLYLMVQRWFEEQRDRPRIGGEPKGSNIFTRSSGLRQTLESIRDGIRGGDLLENSELPFEDVSNDELSQLAQIALEKLEQETREATAADVEERIQSYVSKLQKYEKEKPGSGKDYIRRVLEDVDGQVEILSKIKDKQRSLYRPLFGYTLEQIQQVQRKLKDLVA